MTDVIEPHIKGLIFDLDGTLADTMPFHYLAWDETLTSYGADFPEPLFYDLAGVPSDRIVEILNEKFDYSLNPKAIAAEKEELFLNKYMAQSQPIKSVIEIAYRHKGSMPMAVATGGIYHVASSLLRVINMGDFFDALVTSEDVEHGKPAPDTFLEAARRIGIEPALCQVFEDSDTGIEGAKRAGMVATDVRPWVEKERAANGST